MRKKFRINRVNIFIRISNFSCLPSEDETWDNILRLQLPVGIYVTAKLHIAHGGRNTALGAQATERIKNVPSGQ